MLSLLGGREEASMGGEDGELGFSSSFKRYGYAGMLPLGFGWFHVTLSLLFRTSWGCYTHRYIPNPSSGAATPLFVVTQLVLSGDLQIGAGEMHFCCSMLLVVAY